MLIYVEFSVTDLHVILALFLILRLIFFFLYGVS